MYKLVLVDDETLSLNILSKLISSSNTGFELTKTFDNAQDALSYLRNNHVDVIISDISMPGMNGLDFLKSVKLDFPDIVFIFLTGYKNFEYMKFAISHNVADYLTKPLDKNELLQLLAKTKTTLDKTRIDAGSNYQELLCQQALIDYISKKESSPDVLIKLMSEAGINVSNADIPVATLYTTIKNIDSVISHFYYGADRFHTALIQLFKTNNLPVLSINYSISSMNIILFLENDNVKNKLEQIIIEYEKNCRQILNVDITVSVTGIYNTLSDASDAILKMLNLPSIDTNSTIKNEHIKAAISYIKANYKSDLSLTEVANYVNLTTYHFSKLFKSTIGTSFINYINTLRIQKAQDMLLDTFMSVAEISENSGFSSTNNFFRVFKKITGMSPQQYRSTQVKNHESKGNTL